MSNSIMHVTICSISILVCCVAFVIKPKMYVLLYAAICAPAMLMIRSPFDWWSMSRLTRCSLLVNLWFDYSNKLFYIADLYLLAQITSGIDYKIYLYYCIIAQVLNYVVFVVGVKRCKDIRVVNYY